MATTTRSPNYPQMNIVDAVERIRQVYQKEHTHKASYEVIAQALGYNSLNGTSRGVISALKKYGLLVPEGDGFRVSDEALAILELPSDDQIRINALREAALKPVLFAELFETYGSNLPSDSNLRHFLVTRKFNPVTADEVIRLYRETISLLAQLPSDKREENNNQANKSKLTDKVPENKTEQSRHSPITGNPRPNFSDNLGAFADELHLRISEDCKAHLLFEGIITQEAIAKLIKYLELGTDNYPTKAQLTSSHNVVTNTASTISSLFSEEE